MKKNLSLLLFLFCLVSFANNVFSNVVVKGKVIDSSTKEAVPYANAILMNEKDSSLVIGVLTDLDGKFQLKATAGKFILKIQFISYKSAFMPVTITTSDFDAGTIKLSPEGKTLKELVITEEKRQTEISADKLIYNPEKDLTVTGGTAADVLKNTPLVTVASDGAVSLQGKPEVRILINGRQSSLTSTAALQQLPADAIERVEVMTNPSSKYDAEGGAGIINIVLKRNKKLGLNGMTTLKGGIRHDDIAGWNLGYGGSKWKFDGSCNLRYFEHYGTFKNLATYNFPGEQGYTSTQDTKFTGKRLTNNLSFSTEFNPDEKNSFYTGFFIQKTHGDNSNNIQNITNNPLAFQYSKNDFKTIEDDGNFNFDYSLDYSHSYSKENTKHKLTANFSTSYNDHSKSQDRSHVYVYYPSGNLTEQYVFNDLNKTYNFQADYVHPFKSSTFETGIKNAVRDLYSDFAARNYDSPGGNLLPNAKLQDYFNYGDWIGAAYVNFATKLKSFDVQAGLRAENTYIKADLNSAGKLNRNYIDVFPSVFLSRKFYKNHTISVSSTRRINRPWISSLYPFARYPDPFNIWQGNMNLKPEYVIFNELSYNINYGRNSIIAKVNYGLSKGAMQEVRTVKNGINIGRTENLESGYNAGFNLIVSQALAKWWTMNGSTNFNRIYSNGENLGLGTSTVWGHSHRVSSNFKLPWKTDFQVTYFFFGRLRVLQMNQDPFFNIGIALKKELFKSKGNLNFQINDMFNTSKYHFVNTNANYVLNSTFYMQQYRYTLTFTYKFNNYQEKKRNEQQGGGGGMGM